MQNLKKLKAGKMPVFAPISAFARSIEKILQPVFLMRRKSNK